MNQIHHSAGEVREPLTAAQRLVRLTIIGALMLVLMALFAYVGGWLSPSRLTPSRMVAAFQETNGSHAGFRRNHAKGVCVAGWFESSGNAAEWSKAAIFESGRIPLIGRFALAGGMPFQSDSSSAVRSMALRLTPPNGPEWRTGMNNIPVFAVNTAEAFYEQLVASKPDPATGKPDPAAIKEFIARHPETARAIAAIKAYPASAGFADATFNSLDAFRLVNSAGTSIPVRWAAVPLQAAVVQADSPDDDSAHPASGNRLFDDLVAQIHEHPLQWRLVITIGQPGDPTIDATLAWPDDRRHIDAGIVTVDQVSSEDGGACADINFDPLVLPPGIEPSDDPLLSARSAVYARSFLLRAAEKPAKPPSAVTPREAQGVAKP
ncbi:MAG: Catalase domain protein [Gammaproteobacteria bacterium]|nr:Catalase domain protein [Gammaproteobacteria bacterium]